VGISIYPGADSDKNPPHFVGNQIVKALEKAGIDAQCFVNNTMFEDSGTALSFKIGGLSIKVDGDDTFNLLEVAKKPSVMKAVVNEAKTAKNMY
jgi:hypothetical protein